MFISFIHFYLYFSRFSQMISVTDRLRFHVPREARPLVADFVNAVVGERLGDVQLEAAEVLQKLFAEQVETTGGDEVPLGDDRDGRCWDNDDVRCQQVI